MEIKQVRHVAIQLGLRGVLGGTFLLGRVALEAVFLSRRGPLHGWLWMGLVHVVVYGVFVAPLTLVEDHAKRRASGKPLRRILLLGAIATLAASVFSSVQAHYTAIVLAGGSPQRGLQAAFEYFEQIQRFGPSWLATHSYFALAVIATICVRLKLLNRWVRRGLCLLTFPYFVLHFVVFRLSDVIQRHMPGEKAGGDFKPPGNEASGEGSHSGDFHTST